MVTISVVGQQCHAQPPPRGAIWCRRLSRSTEFLRGLLVLGDDGMRETSFRAVFIWARFVLQMYRVA